VFVGRGGGVVWGDFALIIHSRPGSRSLCSLGRDDSCGIDKILSLFMLKPNQLGKSIMNNPIHPAIRFLQNLPGECNRTAFYIAKAVIAKPRLSVALGVAIGVMDFSAWQIGGLTIKALPGLQKFIHDDTVPVLMKGAAAGVTIYFCVIPFAAIGITIYSLNNLRKSGEQMHHLERWGPWGFRPNPPPSHQP
jgi:hypothetical protein